MSIESPPGKDLQPLLFLMIFLCLWKLTPITLKLGPNGSHPASNNATSSWKTQIQLLLPATSPKHNPHVPSLHPQRSRRTPTMVNSTPKLAADLPAPRCPRNPAKPLLSVCPSLSAVPCPLSEPGHARNFPGSLLLPRRRPSAAVPRYPSFGITQNPKASQPRLFTNPSPWRG